MLKQRTNKMRVCAFATFLLLMLAPQPEVSATKGDLPGASATDPGYCFKLASHVLEEYMLSVVFDKSFGQKIASIKLTPSIGQIVEGYVPLRNWATTLEGDHIFFEKQSDGSPDATVGFVVGIKYNKTVDYIDVEMVQETTDGDIYTWNGDTSDTLPYHKAFRVVVPSLSEADLTLIPVEEGYQPCYNEDYLPQPRDRTLMVVTSLGVFLLTVTLVYGIARRALLR